MPVLGLQEVTCEHVDFGLSSSLCKTNDGFHITALQ